MSLKALKKKKLNRAKSALILDRYKYHKLHIEKLSKYKEMGLLKKCNDTQNVIYNPNFDYIYKKIISGPRWKNLAGRKHNKLFNIPPYTNISINETNYTLFAEGKGFISMEKQTQRNGFPISNNLREKYEKKFEPLNQKLNIKENKNILNKTNNISFSIKDNKNLFKTRLRNIKKINKYKSVPDFNRYLSREKMNKILKYEKSNPCDILYPNYNTIEERAKMMVVYNKRFFSPKKKEFQGMNRSDFYDANKIYNSLKGNKSSIIKFDKMTSRPYDKYLPVYMKGIHSRIVCEEKNDKTLEMNNYSNGKFFDLNNTFNQRSFNKYVNLCLLKSDYIQPENIKNNSEFKLLSRNFQNSDIYNDSIQQVLEGVKMNKFDKITYKSINNYKYKKRICNL